MTKRQQCEGKVRVKRWPSDGHTPDYKDQKIETENTKT